MGLDPLPNIRDGILVECLVKTMRYVADMWRCQYVVQRPDACTSGRGTPSHSAFHIMRSLSLAKLMPYQEVRPRVEVRIKVRRAETLEHVL
jgi:hypothetical protein